MLTSYADPALQTTPPTAPQLGLTNIVARNNVRHPLHSFRTVYSLHYPALGSNTVPPALARTFRRAYLVRMRAHMQVAVGLGVRPLTGR